MLKSLIAIPALSHIDYRLMHVIMQSGVPLLPLYGFSDLARVRSVLLTKAVAKGAERILLIDSDIVPTVDQIAELTSTSLVTPDQAVTGLYPVKGRNAWAVHAATPEEAEKASEGEDFDAEWAGLGFACVHRESLIRLISFLPLITDPELQWTPFCVPGVVGNTYYPDDRVLWWRLANSGVKLRALSHLKVGHVSSEVLTEPRG